jgi:hypothetical protein
VINIYGSATLQLTQPEFHQLSLTLSCPFVAGKERGERGEGAKFDDESTSVVFFNQCWGSMTFCCGSGSGDPCLWLMWSIVRKQCCGSGSGAFLTPGSRMGKKSGSGSGMNNPDHISEEPGNNFLGQKSWILRCGYGMEKIRIRDNHHRSATLLERDFWITCSSS